MAVKIFFIGNVFGEDDGIGPYLYNELKDDPTLQKYTMEELGVIGFDLVTYVENGDDVIIVDAVRTENQDEIGNVIVIGEENLSRDLVIISQHDFGVEQTAAILRNSHPDIKSINIIGIQVNQTAEFTTNLSEKIQSKIETIKGEVLKKISSIVE